MLACVCTLSQSESPTVCIRGQGPSKNLGGQVKGHSPACLSVHCETQCTPEFPAHLPPTHGSWKALEVWVVHLPAPGRTRTEGACLGRNWDTPFRDYRNRLNRLRPAGPGVAYQPFRHKGTGSSDLAIPLERLHLHLSFPPFTILERRFSEAIGVKMCLRVLAYQT